MLHRGTYFKQSSASLHNCPRKQRYPPPSSGAIAKPQSVACLLSVLMHETIRITPHPKEYPYTSAPLLQFVDIANDTSTQCHASRAPKRLNKSPEQKIPQRRRRCDTATPDEQDRHPGQIHKPASVCKMLDLYSKLDHDRTTYKKRNTLTTPALRWQSQILTN